MRISDWSSDVCSSDLTNSANRGFNLITKYPRADFICIDEPEARLAAVERYAPIETVVREKLQKKIACHTFVITHGKLGSIVYKNGRASWRERVCQYG